MVLTASFVLSPAIGLVCHRRLARLLARLDAGVEASGPHDFTVRVGTIRQGMPTASTASRPASVTIAIRPFKGDGIGSLYSCFYQPAKRNIFANKTGRVETD
jgi:hypothetical protein